MAAQKSDAAKQSMERTVSTQQQLITASADPVRARRVTEVPVATEMSDSFLAYALSVITSRAIPDVRDGLKPVQRRVLWSMLQMRLLPGTPYRKSARIVGDTMGRYHPHGDAAIYDTLTRMGQDFSRMVPLVDPQGNFGSLDDPPAAARYTECRLSAAAMDMVAEVDEDTVDFRPTYDGEGTEPAVLPAALPNLLVNGTAGIAVGMATSMLPNNLAEIGDAIVAVMSNRSRAELMDIVAGPDFPGGGIVLADDGLRRAYDTGRGSVRVRARVSLEQVTRRRQAIVVTELPHLVGPERVVSKIAELVDAARLPGVSGVADLTGMDGLRLQIDLKPDADAGSVLASLYRLTPLEESFSVNNVVLVDGVPTTLGLRELCDHYVSHRLEVIVRRSRHRLRRATERLHIVEGLLVALDHIDEIVDLIRRSADAAEARSSLMGRFGLSEIQASHILDMALRRLTALEHRKLADEAAGLRYDIDELRGILASERKRRNIVRRELRRVVADHGLPRRTQIVDAQTADHGLSEIGEIGRVGDVGGVGAEQMAAAPAGRDVPCVVTLSTSGNVGRMPPTGARKPVPGRHDLIASRVSTSTASRVAAITTEGRVMHVPAADIAEAGNRIRGSEAAAVFGLGTGERVLALVTASEHPLVLVTAAGVVKRLAAAEVLRAEPGSTVITLARGDRVAAAFAAPDETDIVIASSDGRVLRTASSTVRIQRPAGSGVAGMRLVDNAGVVGAAAVYTDSVILQATSTGGVKSTRCAELPTQGRGGQGVLAAKLAPGETVEVVAAGTEAGMLALMAHDDNPRRIDPVPVPLREQPTPRYRAPTPGERRIRALAPGRW